MAQEQLQEAYNQLERICQEFSSAYYTSRKGKNKQIRAAADRNVESLITRAKFYLSQNAEIYELASGGPGNSNYDKAIQLDEFFQPRYFEGEMAELLQKVREKLNN